MVRTGSGSSTFSQFADGRNHSTVAMTDEQQEQEQLGELRAYSNWPRGLDVWAVQAAANRRRVTTALIRPGTMTRQTGNA